MHKLAIMQPYFLPYIGYFQLMSSVDQFVLYDNVQFIKNGWINRNRILVDDSDFVFTLPLKKDSHKMLINERCLSLDTWNRERRKILARIQQSYCKAEFFAEAYPLIERCIRYESNHLFSLIHYSINQIKDYIGINTEILISSQLDVDHLLSGQNRVIAICKYLSASHYINAIGGVSLYSQDDFNDNGIQLSFVKSKVIKYQQFGGRFIPDLSIIDVLMFNSPEQIRRFLTDYELLN